MEIQVEFFGSDDDLKNCSYMVFALSCQFSNLVSINHFKGNAYMYIHFLNHKLFEKSVHAHPFCFSIAKGLATCRLGSVISARKVLF